MALETLIVIWTFPFTALGVLIPLLAIVILVLR